MQLPLISIITVVYNDIAHIVETLDSVTTQDYPQIEYIIIDGASSDGTREKIMEYIASNADVDSRENTESQSRIYLEATHREKNFTFKFLSEADSGIYDAMNKGIDLATGEWCNFMNCGDRFYNSHTILELFTRFFVMHGGGAAHHNFANFIIYGDTQIIYDKKHSKILYASTKPHKYHHRFIHQSAFIATSLMRTHHYDTSFKIAGDTDFFTKAYNSGVMFLHIPLVISSFNVDGVSSSLSWQMFKEDCQIGYKYNCLFPIFHTLKYMFWVIPRVCIRNAIPANFRNQARILLGKKTN